MIQLKQHFNGFCRDDCSTVVNLIKFKECCDVCKCLIFVCKICFRGSEGNLQHKSQTIHECAQEMTPPVYAHSSVNDISSLWCNLRVDSRRSYSNLALITGFETFFTIRLALLPQFAGHVYLMFCVRVWAKVPLVEEGSHKKVILKYYSCSTCGA